MLLLYLSTVRGVKKSYNVGNQAIRCYIDICNNPDSIFFLINSKSTICRPQSLCPQTALYRSAGTMVLIPDYITNYKRYEKKFY